jgi:hypothetical protein
MLYKKPYPNPCGGLAAQQGYEFSICKPRHRYVYFLLGTRQCAGKGRFYFLVKDYTLHSGE